MYLQFIPKENINREKYLIYSKIITISHVDYKMSYYFGVYEMNEITFHLNQHEKFRLNVIQNLYNNVCHVSRNIENCVNFKGVVSSFDCRNY